MTTEQALKILKQTNQMANEAYDMANKALEQQSSDDCVSRQAVISKKELIELPDGQSFYSIDPEEVENMPPVTPTFPKGTTNYDVLKAVFGGISAFRIKDTMEFEKGFEFWFSEPYKRGDSDGSN